MKSTWSVERKIIFVLSSLALLGLALVLLPSVRVFIMGLTENFVLQRQMNSPDVWLNRMFMWSIQGILFFASVFSCTIFWEQLKLKLKRNKTINSAIFSVTTINYRQFVKPVLVMFGIYTLGISAIIRADFLFQDDIIRSVSGFRGWGHWSRHISNFLAVFIHADIQINDISPLTQLIAAFLIAASSVALVYVINNEKITKTALAASIPIGLSPYFLECFSYKFDAPYMALSVFASIVPFVFVKNRLAFSVASVLGMLIMCMTYQASSGIYIIIVILLCFQQWSMKQKTNSEIFAFMGIAVISYCIAMIIFRVFFMTPLDAYVSTSVHPFRQMLPGIAHNASNYLRHVRNDFGMIWKALLLFSGISFWIKCIITTKRHKVFATFVGLAIIALMAILSFGVYLILAVPLFAPRGMLGFGVFIAILGIYAAGSVKKAFALPALALCWSFFVFSFSYGNALARQKRHIEFRTEMLLHDLGILFPEIGKVPRPMKIIGTAGHAPVIYNIAARNPVIKRLVRVNLGGGWTGGILLRDHHNYYDVYTSREFDDTTEEGEFEQIFDSRYHTIKSDGERVMIFLK